MEYKFKQWFHVSTSSYIWIGAKNTLIFTGVGVIYLYYMEAGHIPLPQEASLFRDLLGNCLVDMGRGLKYVHTKYKR